ncbi:MAG: caspase family protein [Chitinophagaceae bacterium]|nr:caspase family protein [Chitinophagaceae bacterium]
MRYFLLLLSVFITINSLSQKKLALIVAVGEYPAASKIKPIASVNDVKYIKAALGHNGFAEKNIDTLINGKATKAAILKALDRLAANANSNDIVVIHFSCHGQQIRDQKTIELGKDEDDGYDEAFLPYDAMAKYSPTGYRGQNHLRDDDLYPLLLSIRKKLGAGGSLLVLLDACHSGTGTRDESFAVTRGEPIPFPDPENPQDSVINLSAAEAKQGFFETIADSVANLVVISASSPHQENKQVVVNNEELGSLTYSFYKALHEMTADNSYGLLFEKIRATMQAHIPEQIPMIEGNVQQFIFSGKYKTKEDKVYIRVGTPGSSATRDSVFAVEKGLMDNIANGATCKIYQAESKEVYANAVIKRVENFKSYGVAERGLNKNELYELKIDEENYGNLEAALKLSFPETDPATKKLEKQVKQFIKPYAFLKISEQADFQLEVKKQGEGKQATLTDRNNKPIWSAAVLNKDSLSAEQQQQFIAGIKKELRIKYLRTMPDGGELAQYVTAEIVPAKGHVKPAAIELGTGDGYALHIRNNSNHRLYYTVLDIYPDNQVEILYPYKGKEPADYAVEKNSVVIRKLAVSAGTPPGTEFLKIIVSREPMDLRSVFEKKITRDNMQSFQTLLDDLFNEKPGPSATRADISGIKTDETGIITVSFIIKKD